MARPKLNIDPDLVRRLASINATTAEIASVCKCSQDTLERRFADIIKDGRAEGITSLKRKQMQLALEGNPTMLVWLGKVLLGQREVSDYNIQSNNTNTTYSKLSDEELDSKLLLFDNKS